MNPHFAKFQNNSETAEWQSTFRIRLAGEVLFASLLLAVVAGAAVLRLVDPGNRPMHCDEAVHAMKFGRLLEEADYVYDPREYHGPSLNYLTLPLVRLAGAEKLTQVTETDLRLLPALFGIALVALVWFVRDELGRAAALAAAVLTAVSPAMVFYSRYYIQEMLLVFFTFGAIVALQKLRKGARTLFSVRSAVCLVLLGVCIGMMHASKETCVIALAAMAVAAAVAVPDFRRIGLHRLLVWGLVVAAVAACVSAVLFSSFLKNPRGVIDSVTTYFYYLGRASGEANVGRHVHPWDYYLRILFWWRSDGQPVWAVWTEGSIAALALVGLVAAALGKGIRPVQLPTARFLGIYTVFMTVVYSALPYKTPWCALSFLHGMILLAGVGATVLVRRTPMCALTRRKAATEVGAACRAAPQVPPGRRDLQTCAHRARILQRKTLKSIVIVLLLALAGHLTWQAYRASFVEYVSPSNPFVYSHTTADIPRLARRVEQLAAASPDGRAMYIQVICPDHDYWPLPWYLRDFRRVGWFGGVPEGPAAPLIITQPEMEPALLDYLYRKQPPGRRHLYMPVRPEQPGREWRLRPYVPLRVYARLDLWEAQSAGRSSALVPPHVPPLVRHAPIGRNRGSPAR